MEKKMDIEEQSQIWEELERRWVASTPNIDYIEIIKDDDEFVDEKIRQLKVEIRELQDRLELRTLLRGRYFRGVLKGSFLNVEKREMLWQLVYMFYEGPLVANIERLEKELSRVRNVRSILDSRYKNIRKEGRITEDDIRLAKTIPIQQFYDGHLRNGSGRLVGKCPFHEEKTGSFVIYKNSNTYHCFGCGKGGDVISYIQERNKFDFLTSVKYLLGR